MISTIALLLKSILAGFVVAMPIGAIGAMCLRRALQGRWLMGLLTGFGAATADAILATAAIFGLSLFTRYILDNQRPVLLVGGVFLILIGLRIVQKRRPKLDPDPDGLNGQRLRWRAWLSAVATGFALTIINPATLLAFVGVFAGLGLFQDRLEGLLQSWIIVLGAFMGSMMWWGTLMAAGCAVRRHLSIEWVSGVNVVLGVVVIGFGCAGLLSVFGVQF